MIVNLKDIYLMVQLVMHQEILTMDHLTQRNLTFKEIVNMSLLNLVTIVTSSLQQLTHFGVVALYQEQVQ